MENKRDFKGIWIPKEIWLAQDLSSTEKLLYAEIQSLDGEQGCWASNAYLASFFGLKERQIRNGIAALKKKKLIAQVGFNGRFRILKVVNNLSTGAIKCRAGWQKIATQSGTELPPYNIVDNKVDNNNIQIKKQIKQLGEKMKIKRTRRYR